MSDWADLAADREAEWRADALAEHARRAAPQASESAATCAVCEEPIPEARRHYLPGVQTCVECQAELERALQMKERMS